MELLQLKYFCDAAESENFSHTAKKFYVPASNISQTIKRLEAEIGTELFTHMSNRIVLNECGKAFYECAKRALCELDKAKDAVYAVKDEICAEVKILALTNRRIVTKAIEKIRADYPGISFILNYNPSYNGDSDIIISDIRRDDKKYDSALLVCEDILLAMSDSHPLAKKDKLSVLDVREERFISMSEGSSLFRITQKVCSDSGFLPFIAIQCDDPYSIREYIEMGLGIAFVPVSSWKGLLSEKIVLKKPGDIKRETFISTYREKSHSKAVRLLVQSLKDEATDY